MRGVLSSDDAVTRALNGKPTDFVPVAPAYEGLGPLQFWRMERTWRAWSERLEAAGTDLLPVDYRTYLEVEHEISAELLDGAYARPAWVDLPRNQTEEDLRGSAIARRNGELFWLSGDGSASWLPPNRIAHQEAAAADEKQVSRWTSLWDRSNASGPAVQQAAARYMHELRPASPPAEAQAAALAGSQRYDLARALASRYPDALPLYTRGSCPYNWLPGLFGFQNLMYALIEQPDLVHRILENWLPQPSARLVAERQLGISLMFVPEIMASVDIISPAMYREFAFPYAKQALQFYEDMGFRTVLYFSGNLMPLLPYLNKLPFTALCFEENRKDYGIDLTQVRRALPEKILFGNVDAAWLEKASDQEVLAEVRRQIAVTGANGRFVLSVGSPFTPGTSLDRVRLFCESTQRL